ncbi:MAG TPA: hypothetical protein VGN42_06600 [Pirellulales bacterium]|jgi:hypothetical protein|nr:hypothetical protein [Pirellulales bacterium]
MSARDPRDDLIGAYYAACRILVALARLSSAVNENREALRDETPNNPWPESLMKTFGTLANKADLSWKITPASLWIPPRPTEICGITETSMHAAMSACATYAQMTYVLQPERGWPSAKEALSRFADFPASWVDGMLRVERLQAEAAVEASKTAPQPAMDDPEIGELVTLNQVAPLAGLSKRTLERYLTKGDLPEPDIPGGGGRAHKWFWHTLRPSLSKVAKRSLPETFPGSRVI